jgi:hypothetical protein
MWCLLLQMEKQAATAAATAAPSRVRLVRCSPQGRALSLAEGHVTLEPASLSISFKAMARSQALIKQS